MALLFDDKHDAQRKIALQSAIDSLNQYLHDTIESVLAQSNNGGLAIEAKTPLDIEAEIGLPRGNIFQQLPPIHVAGINVDACAVADNAVTKKCAFIA